MKKAARYLMLTFCMMLIFVQSVFAGEKDYVKFFLPEKDGVNQPFVGDTMPYYEDGVYYIYYLKEGGDSYRHSIYLTTTTDFLTYEDVQEPILVSSSEGAQDAWIGTGSVVKVEDTYYLFYTGHADNSEHEFNETVMLAKGSDLRTFEKVADWEMIPDESLGQKRDFRDPQAYYDEEKQQLVFTITAAQEGVARILKYTVSKDLSEITYDGIIFTDPIGKVYNLECSDTFKIGDTYYLTYSAQDDTLWYAASTEPYGPYSDPVRMDGPLFYAAKHVEDGEHAYMVGWGRRSKNEANTTSVDEWAGNLVAQEIHQKEDGSLVLAPVAALEALYQNEQPLTIDTAEALLEAGEDRVYADFCNAEDSFMLKGNFTFEGTGKFGLAFTYKDGDENDKLITVSPRFGTLTLNFKAGKRRVAELDGLTLNSGETYSFTYIQENSLGVFYIDDVAAFTVRLYKVNGKPIRLFAEDMKVQFSDLKLFTE
ncbi:MAG: DUF4975 domain-containing protein [Clostridiales bacterium]|nr:DUF4975 domain-containing protein [Candidatus Blautia equi]